MRRFAYACLGVLALALAFHLGAQTARAGATGRFVSIASDGQGAGAPGASWVAITEEGEWWWQSAQNGPEWHLGGMIGGATALEPSTWGQIKAKARQ